MRVLILGGTTEASQLARGLAGDGRFAAMLSLAGRTEHPAEQPLAMRSGGFGGVAGLARVLGEFDALVDATHPFAAQISRNAAEASRIAGVALLAIRRPAWTEVPGDDWRSVPDMEAAAIALGTEARRVFLTVGQKDLAPFGAAPWHDYLIRSVDPPASPLPPRATVIAARGPFLEADERRLLAAHRIEVLVTKNSGGSATEAKLAAARGLGVPVVMVARPPPPEGVQCVASAAEALAWLHRRLRGA
jgi:precorrin-6A/cobalt-precorrin-6A reductase